MPTSSNLLRDLETDTHKLPVERHELIILILDCTSMSFLLVSVVLLHFEYL